MEQDGRKTPFYEAHINMGGRMVDYSSWLLPVEYAQGLAFEVLAVRKRAALFDVSHMGEILVRGKGAEAYLQRLITNDISNLKENRIGYSPLCYPDGGTVDDILVYCLGAESYLLVVNAANTEKDFAWMKENLSDGAHVQNVSGEYAQLALQGPLSQKILNKICSEDVGRFGYYSFRPRVKLAGIECLLSRTGYTGEDGFEIYCRPDDGTALWNALFEAGEKEGLIPAGLGARDVLRLEAGMPLYGHELSPEISPLQANLDRFIAYGKPGGFIGLEALSALKEKGVKHRLYGIEMLERGVPRSGYPVLVGEEVAGAISSGSFSPTLNKFVAMAFLDEDVLQAGEGLKVKIRKRTYQAVIKSLPFYRREKQ